jgi:hypothetical protein
LILHDITLSMETMNSISPLSCPMWSLDLLLIIQLLTHGKDPLISRVNACPRLPDIPTLASAKIAALSLYLRHSFTQQLPLV